MEGSEKVVDLFFKEGHVGKGVFVNGVGPFVDGMEFFGVSDVKNVLLMLREFGVAVLPILNADECRKMLDGAWHFLETITSAFSGDAKPIKRDDRSTWHSFELLQLSSGQLFQRYGVGHAEFLWILRQHPKVLEVFQTIYGVKNAEDLLVSFDGMSFCLPPEITNKPNSLNKNKESNKNWHREERTLHTDQAFKSKEKSRFKDDKGFLCVQSWVTACDVKNGGATLVVVPKSHKFHEKFGKQFDLGHVTKDWFQLQKKEGHYDFLKEHNLQPVYIKVPAGSMVLWDSRTFHTLSNPVKGRVDMNAVGEDAVAEMVRLVAYLCYTPRSVPGGQFMDIKTLASENKKFEKALQKKRQAYVEGRTTSHWPHRPKLFGQEPHTRGKELPKVVEVTQQKKRTRTFLELRLAGFTSLSQFEKMFEEHNNKPKQQKKRKIEIE